MSRDPHEDSPIVNRSEYAIPRPAAGDSNSVRVTLDDLRYGRETFFFEKFAEGLEQLRKENSKMSEQIEAEEERFFEFLSHSVKVDQMGNVPHLIEQVRERVGTDIPINMFLYESPTASAAAMARMGNKSHKIDELLVLVSQHYFNDLSDEERAAILGHELGHLLLGHIRVPVGALLAEGVDYGKNPEVRANIMRWAICREISCDICAYVATGGDARACSTALLKFTTGLNAQAFESLGADHMIQQVLSQYSYLSNSVVESVISSHPLPPLRLKIMSAASHMGFLGCYGHDLPRDQFQQMQTAYNNTVDAFVREIYPELFGDQPLDEGFILFYLCVAIALADGQMTPDEIEVIQKLVSGDIDTSSFFQSLNETLRDWEPYAAGEELVDRAIEEAKEKNYGKNEATVIVKNLLQVAAADGKVAAKELKMAYRFASNFGFTKQEVVYLANQAKI